MVNKFTTHMRHAIGTAALLAQHGKRKRLHGADLFVGLALDKGGLASNIMEDFFGTEFLNELIPPHFSVEKNINMSALPSLTKDVEHMLQRATSYAYELEHQFIGTEHALLALMYHPDKHVKKLFDQASVQMADMKQAVMNVMGGTTRFNEMQHIFEGGNGQSVAQKGHIDGNSTPQSATPALDYFGTELTSRTKLDTLDPVVGRDDEIERVLTILARRTKNNPVLIGDPGVGKTAIVEGLARRITEGNVPEMLLNKRIIALDLGMMVAGTMYRGEFESRLKQVITEMEQQPDIVVFIDEIHMLVGAGGTQGSNMDAANILKPALANGAISCIGATTPDEYKKTIEEDGALDRRFQSVVVNEPSPAETVAILRGLKKRYEAYHHMTVADEVLEQTVVWSNRFLPEQRLPDKAIDLIDEAGASGYMKRTLPKPVQQVYALRRELRDMMNDTDEAIRQDNLDRAIELKDREETLLHELKKQQDAIESIQTPRIALTTADIARVVHARTGIAIEHITATGRSRTKTLKKRISSTIVGQKDAVSSLVSVLQRASVGLTPEHRPLGSFLFLGPSGVGKTLLAKTVAREHFGDDDALIRVDMSEFSEGFTVSKLIGAPAGYVGHKESSSFIDSIRKHPYSVVLFDEIEKAHPDVYQLLLQILDEGHLTDATGRQLNFRNTIIIMTSNIGIDALTQQAKIGFDNVKKSSQTPFAELESSILGELSEYFPQEMLNRIDKKIVFAPLTQAQVSSIVAKEFRSVAARAKAQGITLVLRASAKKWIARASFDAEHGARKVMQTITAEIENPLAQMMVNGRAAHGDTIIISTQKEKLHLAKKE
jgi:ATP-dependent Clp protease ATP-binding subunit ClpC